MKVYLLSNNLVMNDITYMSRDTLEQKRVSRPLSIEGEEIAKKLSIDTKVGKIYSSSYASALATAKYFSSQSNCIVNINSTLNDSVIGDIGKHNIKMLRFMQERNFDFKYPNGESLNETKSRMKKIFYELVKGENEDILIVSHKRSLMGLLMDFCEIGYNLDDRLILMYNDIVIIDDNENDYDFIVITIDDRKIENIELVG